MERSLLVNMMIKLRQWRNQYSVKPLAKTKHSTNSSRNNKKQQLINSILYRRVRQSCQPWLISCRPSFNSHSNRRYMRHSNSNWGNKTTVVLVKMRLWWSHLLLKDSNSCLREEDSRQQKTIIIKLWFSVMMNTLTKMINVMMIE